MPSQPVSPAGGPALSGPTRGPLIADRAEFVFALRQLQAGHVLVRVSDISWGCQLNGVTVLRSVRPLLHYGLIAEFHNPAGFAGVSYFRLSPRGRRFAPRVLASWRQRPLWQRVLLQLTG